MLATDTDYDALSDVHAYAQRITIAPGWRPAIKQSLIAIAAAMQALDEFELPDEIEPAPVFQP